MRKYILINIFFLLSLIYGQNKQQSIELPDFVITGIQTVEVPKMKKNKIEFVPTLSKEFFLPVKSPSEFQVKLLDNINPPDTNVNYIPRPFNGIINLGAGVITFPSGKFSYSSSSRFVMLTANVYGLNEKDYITNAGYNVSGANINTDFFISGESSFLPGSQISFNGDFYRDEYKFFGSSINPAYLRKTNKIQAGAEFKNTFGEINVGANLDFSQLKIDDLALTEKLINLNGFADFNLYQFAVRSNAKILKQFLTNNISGNGGDTYINLNAVAKQKISNNLELRGGLNFSDGPNSSTIYPQAFVSFKLSDNISVYGEFAPNTEFLTLQNIILKNRYMVPGFADNCLIKNYSNITGSAKYSFDKYVEIGFTVNLKSSDNYLFYQDLLNDGNFNVLTANAVKTVSASLDMIFHKGPYGFFTGKLEYRSVKSAGKYIPYEPNINGELKYNHTIDKISFSTELVVKNNFYSDILNTSKIDSFINLNVYLRYELFSDFNLSLNLNNLINRKNYIFRGYQEKTIDAVLGFEYRW